MPRRILKRPAFFLAVVLTLTLGIGANSAIFSVIDAILLKPLPYPSSERLMALYEVNPKQKTDRGGVAPVRVEEWNRLSRSFNGITGAYTESMAETSAALPERLVVARCSPRFFSVLGTPPLLGRGFSPEEDLFNGPSVAVLSEHFWHRRFNGEPVRRRVEAPTWDPQLFDCRRRPRFLPLPLLRRRRVDCGRAAAAVDDESLRAYLHRCRPRPRRRFSE